MRVKCRYCHRKAIITHSVELSDQVTELYVSCSNPNCGARTVVRLFYANTITPPAETLLNSLHEQIAEMDPGTRRELFRPYKDELPLFAP